MKRNKNFTWRRVDAASLDLKGMKVAIVGGTGGIGRALSRFMASRGASVVVVGQTFRDSDVRGPQRPHRLRSGQLHTQIEQRMHLHRSLGGAKVRPWKQRSTFPGV
jgi:NAD(P)-dependent dehydrogenase (short-subunit alcohol dehydrogenase family)